MTFGFVFLFRPSKGTDASTICSGMMIGYAKTILPKAAVALPPVVPRVAPKLAPVIAHPAPIRPAYHPAPVVPVVPHPAPYHPPKPVHGYKEPAYDGPAVYAYEYGVADEYSGANFGQNEARDGYATNGEYRVALPDGRTQIVTYNVADAYSGYIADVKYTGEPHYGPAPVHPAKAIPHPAVIG